MSVDRWGDTSRWTHNHVPARLIQQVVGQASRRAVVRGAQGKTKWNEKWVRLIPLQVAFILHTRRKGSPSAASPILFHTTCTYFILSCSTCLASSTAACRRNSERSMVRNAMPLGLCGERAMEGGGDGNHGGSATRIHRVPSCPLTLLAMWSTTRRQSLYN